MFWIAISCQVYESYLFLAYFVTGFAFEAFSNVAQWHKRTYCLGNFWSKHLSYGIPANIWNYYCLVQQKTIFLAKLRYFPWLPLQFWFSFLFICPTHFRFYKTIRKQKLDLVLVITSEHQWSKPHTNALFLTSQ